MTYIKSIDNLKLRACHLGVDDEGVVCAFLFDQRRADRMRAIGITEGTLIKCIYKRKGIAAYLARGALIGIRDEDAENILIKPKGDDLP